MFILCLYYVYRSICVYFYDYVCHTYIFKDQTNDKCIHKLYKAIIIFIFYNYGQTTRSCSSNGAYITEFDGKDVVPRPKYARQFTKVVEES